MHSVTADQSLLVRRQCQRREQKRRKREEEQGHSSEFQQPQDVYSWRQQGKCPGTIQCTEGEEETDTL